MCILLLAFIQIAVTIPFYLDHYFHIIQSKSKTVFCFLHLLALLFYKRSGNCSYIFGEGELLKGY